MPGSVKEVGSFSGSCHAGDMGSIPGSRGSPEKEMVNHSNILTWRISWTEEPGGLQSMGSQSQTFSLTLSVQFSSVQFSRSVVSNSLWPHGLQHARPPCPSPTPRVYSSSCPLNWWCHPTISSSVIPFSCLQSFPASGSFSVSQFFTSGTQSTGVSASTSVLPMNIQGWFPLRWTGWISMDHSLV